MMRLGRRSFVAGTAALPLLSGCSTGSPSAAPLVLYDPTLAAGRLFASHAADLDLAAVALAGDRVPVLRTLLSERPASLWGLSRHADQLLAHDVAREHGYRPLLAVQHRPGAFEVRNCHGSLGSVSICAELSGDRWPIVFAEIAAGRTPNHRLHGRGSPALPAMSWVLVPR